MRDHLLGIDDSDATVKLGVPDLAFETCPRCGSATMFRMKSREITRRLSVPMVGCGDAWHYDRPAEQQRGIWPPSRIGAFGWGLVVGLAIAFVILVAVTFGVV